MAWDWSETFKGLIATALGWVGARSVKKAKPLYNDFLKFIKVSRKLQELEGTLSLVQSRQMAIFHIDKTPIFITNEKAELTYVNPAWEELTGMQHEEAEGYGYVKVIHPEHRDEMEKQRKDMIQHPVTFFGEVAFKNLKTGKKINTICRTKLVSQNGKVIETIGRLYVIEDNSNKK